MKLPELNQEYPKQYFKRVRKDMFAQLQQRRGKAKVRPNKSVGYVQQVKSGPKSLFITEYDKVYPKEGEPVVEVIKLKSKKKVIRDMKDD